MLNLRKYDPVSIWHHHLSTFSLGRFVNKQFIITIHFTTNVLDNNTVYPAYNGESLFGCCVR